MLSQNLSDLENEREYARYQLEVRVHDTWRSRTIYACPREWFKYLLAKVPIDENKRFQRVYCIEAHMVMITPDLIGTVVQ